MRTYSVYGFKMLSVHEKAAELVFVKLKTQEEDGINNHGDLSAGGVLSQYTRRASSPKQPPSLRVMILGTCDHVWTPLRL